MDKLFVEMLQGAQWMVEGRVFDDGRVESYFCPCCGAEEEDGHDKDCELAALLTKIAERECSL